MLFSTCPVCTTASVDEEGTVILALSSLFTHHYICPLHSRSSNLSHNDPRSRQHSFYLCCDEITSDTENCVIAVTQNDTVSGSPFCWRVRLAFFSDVIYHSNIPAIIHISGSGPLHLTDCLVMDVLYVCTLLGLDSRQTVRGLEGQDTSGVCFRYLTWGSWSWGLTSSQSWMSPFHLFFPFSIGFFQWGSTVPHLSPLIACYRCSTTLSYVFNAS